MTALAVAHALRGRLVVCLTATLLAACSDSTRDATAPVSRSVPTAAQHDVVAAGDTSVTVFTIDPTTDAWYTIAGGHYLYVDKAGVCDLGAPYGPAYWDTPCARATTPTVVTAKSYVDALGHPHIDFAPALRFATQKGKFKTAAMLFMYDMAAARTPHSTILYCNDDGACVDESEHDRLLRTDADRIGGYLFRQIKHFSGYEVAAGLRDAF